MCGRSSIAGIWKAQKGEFVAIGSEHGNPARLSLDRLPVELSGESIFDLERNIRGKSQAGCVLEGLGRLIGLGRLEGEKTQRRRQAAAPRHAAQAE